MAVSRYNNLVEFINATSGYRKTFKGRFGEQGIRQTGVNKLSYPNQEIYDRIETIAITWKVGDRFYKLSSKYYNNPEYWWVIAWFNKKPTESLLKVGDIVRIPKSIDTLLSTMGY